MSIKGLANWTKSNVGTEKQKSRVISNQLLTKIVSGQKITDHDKNKMNKIIPEHKEEMKKKGESINKFISAHEPLGHNFGSRRKGGRTKKKSKSKSKKTRKTQKRKTRNKCSCSKKRRH
jgi:hypothetical protein